MADRTRDPAVMAGGTDLNRFRHVDAAAEGETDARGDGNDSLSQAPGKAQPGKNAPGRNAPGRPGNGRGAGNGGGNRRG